MSSEISQNKCLNCQTELQGEYCHVCGQKASQRKPSVKEFILEYLNIVFVWDTGFIKTLWQLLSKPGHLTVEYVSGKFVSYMHPLKLNMFLLVTFITMFVLFRSAETMGNSVERITRDEKLYPIVQINTLNENQDYAALLQSGPRDTVQLYATLRLAETYPEYFTYLDETDSFPIDSISLWNAVVPRKLIEDKLIVIQDDKTYGFNIEYDKDFVGMKTLEDIWQQMVKMATNCFPLLILLTAPLLSLLVRIVNRKSKYTQFGHFVFTLHYTAVLEIIIILLYILHLTVSPPSWVMTTTLTLGSVVYLTAAIKRVYETKRWVVAAAKAMLIDFAYGLLLSSIFFVLFLISVIKVIFELAAI